MPLAPDVHFLRPRGAARQAGSTLIEVLVAILILSLGIFALGGMVAYSVQMPKLAGYRATAAALAASHIERIRANPQGFLNGFYTQNLTYDGTRTEPALDDCTFPACTSTDLSNTLADMDVAQMARSLRQELPAGGLRLDRDANDPRAGNLWIIWLEPTGLASLNAATSDNCPSQVTSTYTDPAPRCLYVRFHI